MPCSKQTFNASGSITALQFDDSTLNNLKMEKYQHCHKVEQDPSTSTSNGTGDKCCFSFFLLLFLLTVRH